MRFTIGNKILTGFLAIALLLGLISTLSHYYLEKVDNSYSDLVDRREKILSNSKDMRAETLQQMSSLRDYLLSPNQDGLDRFNQAHNNLTELMNSTLKMVKRDVDKDNINKLYELNQQFKQEADQVIALMETDKEAAAKAASAVIQIGRDIESRAKEIADGQQQLVDEGSAENSALVASVKKVIAVISVIAFLMAVLIGFVISRFISKPIVFIANAAKQIALGNLTLNQIKARTRDEVGDLADSFNQMVRNLRELIAQTADGAEHVAASSEELTASAQQTNVAAEQIASAIQEVAAGSDKQVQSVKESVHIVNEMSVGAQQIAVNAHSVSSSASDAAEKSLEGNHAIQRVIDQMSSIHQTIEDLSEVIHGLETRSQDIGDTVKMISDIAAQTNLLALNASIEASRAGEQGRGFAVVASEIRKLAEQSSKSSDQITGLVSVIQQDTHAAMQSMRSSIKEVDEGILVVHTAGISFQHIDRSVQKVLTQIQEVAAAAEQMYASTDHVSNSMIFISNTVEESALGIQQASASTEEQLASMEEVFSSAASLSQMAEQLQNQIARFRV
ncbi:Methyl-accepting chemotaxis protein McpB [Paenibacillus konkukensis]|uniref:Methyl-accepting chemotaxis protein McpB n=1 Tax=Paenibacillus konkukensis TaxID=2020716 RepID=A0ABY4RH04_9BACL|nr:methyl-accepting chemotaxis protein [Paenibacillus konkukensis]UQZ81721.1 Methyl-accepting chemotaxis protein McpB [Paenibacillus konkukensis]